MIRKYGSRLLALLLVLCMVALCVPVRAYADDPVRPDGYTDEEWEEYLRKMRLTASDDQVTTDTSTTVTNVDTTPTGTTDVTPSVAPTVPEQSVTVEVPVDLDVDVDGSKTVETIPASTEDGGSTEETTITEEYTVAATITDVEFTDGELTDITYDISLNKTVTTITTDENGATEATEVTVPDVDVEENRQAEAAGDPAPQYHVSLSINGMNAQEVTRVTHSYTAKTTQTVDGHEVEETVEATEYYYNVDNGVDEQDDTKKYFTVSFVDNVKEAVVSLWTSFMGKFHITTDAFENQDGTTSSNLASAVNGADSSETVEMLRDYTAPMEAEITDAGNVTVDMNGHTYTGTGDAANAAIRVTGSNQRFTIRNGIANTVTRFLNVLGTGNNVTVEDTKVHSDYRGVQVSGSGNTVTVNRSAIDSQDIGVADFDSGNTITVQDSTIDSNGSDFGIYHSGNYGGAKFAVIGSYVYADGSTGAGIFISGDKSLAKNTLTIQNSEIRGETGVEVKFTDVTVDNSYLLGFGVPGRYTANSNGSTTAGAALAVTDNGSGVTGGIITINSGWFEGSRDINNIYLAAKKNTGDPQAKISVRGGRFTNAAGLYNYIGAGYAAISHNDGSDFPYEVVTRGYTPSRDGYRFLGYTDASGNAITLTEAYRKGVVAYAQWKAIPEKTTKALTVNDLIQVKTDERGCTTRLTVKGDTAYVTVKTAKGEFAPISEVTISSVKQLQLLKIDTLEVQVDEDVTLILDIEEAKANGFADTIEITLEKNTLMITSGKKTCIEMDIGVLKASDKPVEIQLVEGELTIALGERSSLSVDLTKALKTGERIVVKLENGVLKLYDKYNKPIKDT